jgi:hypothetical protein
MDLGMIDKVYPSLKTRALLDERRLDMNRSSKNNDKYVIRMHRKNVWTNQWKQDPRKNFCRLATMILVRNIEEDGDCSQERED